MILYFHVPLLHETFPASSTLAASYLVIAVHYFHAYSVHSRVNHFSLSLMNIQLCGFRGGGNSAAKSIFWQARKGQSFVLVFESERERNAALVFARKYALDCNVCHFSLYFP